MDRRTLSNYGWVITITLILAVLLALATPFGSYAGKGVSDIARDLVSAGEKAIDTEKINTTQIDWNSEFAYATSPEYASLNHKNTIPENAVYYIGVTSNKTADYTGATSTYYTGDDFASNLQTGDVYIYGDYEYRYNNYCMHISDTWKTNESQNGWGVRVIDKTKTEYGPILESINGKPIVNMYGTFGYCDNLTTAPAIPNSVTNMDSTFWGCDKLTTVLEIPSNVTDMCDTFWFCESLVALPDLSKCTQLNSMDSTFGYCNSLVNLGDFVIPNSVTDMSWAFTGCKNLTTPPTIPNSVTNMDSTFFGCLALTDLSDFVIPNSVTNMSGTFQGCQYLIKSPEIPNSVTNMIHTFGYCYRLTKAPTIPNSVTNMTGTFEECKSLSGTITINANPTKYTSALRKTKVTSVIGETTIANEILLTTSSKEDTLSFPFV